MDEQQPDAQRQVNRTDRETFESGAKSYSYDQLKDRDDGSIVDGVTDSWSKDVELVRV